jgi:SAM-dependent methyltransferase
MATELARKESEVIRERCSASKDDFFKYFVCPEDRSPLTREGDFLVSAAGRRYPVVRGVPRFVKTDAYVDSFSFEWNTHTQTQLDSQRSEAMSAAQLFEKTLFTEKEVEGKLVLDAGVGTGRYSEVIASWGGKAIGVDLSFAVEAASHNLEDFSNAFIAQADIGKLPFAQGTFDLIFSIGVLHHTPDTRKYFEALVPLLKPGGTIAIWLYSTTPDYRNRKQWIPFTRHIPDKMFYEWCRWFVPLTHKYVNSGWVRWISSVFPFSRQHYGLENDILDTFDGFSPYYHGIHSPEEVVEWFKEVGLEDIQLCKTDTSVRGRMPL